MGDLVYDAALGYNEVSTEWRASRYV